MFGGREQGGLGLQIGASLGALAAVIAAAALFISKVDDVYERGYAAGTTAHALADAKAVREAQDTLDARIDEIESAHERKVKELENALATTRQRAAAAASRDRAAFNAELVRLRNELRARRNASRAEGEADAP